MPVNVLFVLLLSAGVKGLVGVPNFWRVLRFGFCPVVSHMELSWCPPPVCLPPGTGCSPVPCALHGAALYRLV